MDLDSAADELYTARPEDFVAERDRLATAARDSGDVRLARAVGQLRRPTVSAWVVNLLAREAEGELEELLELGAELREAWSQGDDLTELTRRRGQVGQTLLRRARALTEQAGRTLTGTTLAEVEQTLDAATVDADAAEQVRGGRLLKPLSYSGFAPAPIASSGSRARTSKSEKSATTATTSARRLRDLEDAHTQAVVAATTAERELGEWADELAEVVQAEESISERMDDLERQLAALRPKLTEAERRGGVARREEARARRTADKARQRAESAAVELDTARRATESD